MSSTETTRTPDTFTAMEQDPRWFGFGYIGERRNYDSDSDSRRRLDEFILGLAADWTDDELFAWANSKNGRWTAEMGLGCDDLDARYIVKVAG